MSSWASCVTIDEYITSVILKEIWAVQLLQRPSESVSAFDPGRAKALVARLAPSLASDLLEVAVASVTAARCATPSSLLPDMHQFPSNHIDVEGLSITQRKLLLESLEMILDVFNYP